ncbi:hypothetical protein JCGZ_08615 [Jatropha curcas]|uniref:Uncharacterized protein n=1 Tax=Jatropha curcas TaxID=180498 RepID=A0A067KL47_JATCU|nr:hypothetical protein JCGZ_08615 [Jatropha curcas]
MAWQASEHGRAVWPCRFLEVWLIARTGVRGSTGWGVHLSRSQRYMRHRRVPQHGLGRLARTGVFLGTAWGVHLSVSWFVSPCARHGRAS